MIGREPDLKVGTNWCFETNDALGVKPLQKPVLRQCDAVVVGSHASHHHPLVDAGHMSMADPSLPYYIQDHGPRLELTRLRLHNHEAHRGMLQGS